MCIVNWIALILTMVGAQNWLTIGLFDFNLVSWICMGNTVIERIIYSIVGIASIYIGIVLLIYKGNLPLNERDEKKDTII